MSDFLKRARQLSIRLLTAISQTFFVSNPWTGLAVIATLAVAGPHLAVAGLVVSVLARWTGERLLAAQALLDSGLIELNGWFLGLACASFFSLGPGLVVAVMIGGPLVAVFSIAMRRVLATWDVPLLVGPYIPVFWLLWSALSTLPWVHGAALLVRALPPELRTSGRSFRRFAWDRTNLLPARRPEWLRCNVIGVNRRPTDRSGPDCGFNCVRRRRISGPGPLVAGRSGPGRLYTRRWSPRRLYRDSPAWSSSVLSPSSPVPFLAIAVVRLAGSSRPLRALRRLCRVRLAIRAAAAGAAGFGCPQRLVDEMAAPILVTSGSPDSMSADRSNRGPGLGSGRQGRV